MANLIAQIIKGVADIIFNLAVMGFMLATIFGRAPLTGWQKGMAYVFGAAALVGLAFFTKAP